MLFARHFIFTFSALALLIDARARAQEQPTSLWELNDSVLGLYKNGTERIFRYEQPREALQQEGVTPGTVWFNGNLSGTTYTGTAFVFHRLCGAHSFEVEGTLDAEERSIAFSGEQPMSFDGRCKVVETKEVEFEITLLRTLPPPVVVGSIEPGPSPATEAQEREKARLAAIIADKEREEQRLRDLLAANDRNERNLLERQSQRELEERRLTELRQFGHQREACRRFNADACTTALGSPHATAQDAVDLRSWREIALAYRADAEACRRGSSSACDNALASPALPSARRHQLEQWRAAASPYHRALAWLSRTAHRAGVHATDLVASVRALPTSTHVAGGLAALFAFALAGLALRNRRPNGGDQVAAGESPPSNGMGAQPAAVSTPAASAVPLPYVPALATQHLPATKSSAPTPSPAAIMRDTPGAMAAMELALAYLEEVREADSPGLEDHDLRKTHLNTLALASKQIDAAQKLDPDAILEGEDQKELPYRFSIAQLKSEALLLEGITHQTYDLKRAIPALSKATELDPNNVRAFYVLGLTQAANMNKGAAVAAFERAVALDPKNLAYRKELNRAQSLTVGTIAAYKATRAGEKVFDAGVKTANAGIFVYNIGVVLWNVFAFTWNVVTFPLRITFKFFGFFHRILGF